MRFLYKGPGQKITCVYELIIKLIELILDSSKLLPVEKIVKSISIKLDFIIIDAIPIASFESASSFVRFDSPLSKNKLINYHNKFHLIYISGRYLIKYQCIELI